MGHTTTYEYDNAGHQTAVIDALGGTTTMQYDANGNMTAETDPDGNVTTFPVDANGNQTVEINPLGNKTTTVYNSQGEVSTITDAARARGPKYSATIIPAGKPAWCGRTAVGPR